MELARKSGIPTRVTGQRKRQGKAYLTPGNTCEVNPHKNETLRVPLQRPRILSDTALLPPKKKLKIAAARPKIDGGLRPLRPPLGDINRNITHRKVASDANVKKNVHVVKTVTFKNIDTPTTHVTEKVEETVESRKLTSSQYVCESNTYRSKSIRVSQHKLSQSTDTDILSTSNSKSTFYKNPTPESNVAPPVADRETRSLSPYPKMHVLSRDDLEFFGFAKHAEGKQKHVLHTTMMEFASPIAANVSANTSQVIFQGIPVEVQQPAMKRTLSRRLKPGVKQNDSAPYCLDIYSTEYLDDIVQLQLEDDRKYLVTPNYMDRHNKRNIPNRVALVNWLMRAHEYLDLPPTVLFSTIRLFDKVLEFIPTACNMCQLVGLVIMWIVHKFEDAVNVLTISKMLALCNGAYSNHEFLKMEKKVLAFFGFDLKIPDVTVYIAYYLRKLGIENDLLLYCALYILECYALNVKFSTLVPSMQAAAAICLSLRLLHPCQLVWPKLRSAIGYYHEVDLNDLIKEMQQQLHVVQDPVYLYRQPYKKYATVNKEQVSIVLLQKLVAT